jgi:hypothetical protein
MPLHPANLLSSPITQSIGLGLHVRSDGIKSDFENMLRMADLSDHFSIRLLKINILANYIQNQP